MSNTNLPLTEQGLTQKDMGIKSSEASISERTLAQATGHFYNSLLDVYLSKDNKEIKQQQITRAIEGLPQSARELYKKGLQTFQSELQTNHSLLEQHKGEEIKYLIGSVMKSDGKTQEETDEIFSYITSEQAQFIEPTEGVGIIQVEHELYAHLAEAGIISGPSGSTATCFSSETKIKPSFMIVKKHYLNKGLYESSMSPAEDLAVRHEFHHFIWNFLERGGFVRKVEETSPETSEAFSNFRNELAAYIVNGDTLADIDPHVMTYTTDKDIQKMANDIKILAYICIEIGRSKNVDSSSFLYPVMISRNFTELRTNILKQTPVEKIAQIETVNAMYDLWRNEGVALDDIQTVLKDKQATVSPDSIQEIAMKKLSNPRDYGSFPLFLSDLRFDADKLSEFSTAVTTKALRSNDLLMQALNKKLPFSNKIIADILNLPEQITGRIPITNDPEELILTFISIRRVENDASKAAYKLIIASPEMKTTFGRLIDRIIKKGEWEIKKEYDYDLADESKKQQVNRIIQRRTKLLRELGESEATPA